MGGSVAAHLFWFTRQSFELGLAAAFRINPDDVQIISLAHGGYKQPQQLLALSCYLALGVQFDVVINLDHVSDVLQP